MPRGFIMFSSVFRSSSRTTSTTLVQKMRRTSGHISLVCALLLAGVVSPAWAKPGKSKVTEKPAVKTATKPSAKSAGNKNSNAKTTASATVKKPRASQPPAKLVKMAQAHLPNAKHKPLPLQAPQTKWYVTAKQTAA